MLAQRLGYDAEPTRKDSRVAVLTTGARIPISETGLARLHAWLGRAGR